MTNQQKAPSALEGKMMTKWLWLPAIVGLALYAACSLDDPDPPPLAGPSELGLAIELRAVPDQLVSDGFSSSIIEAVVRDSNGQRVQVRTINFDITRSGAGFHIQFTAYRDERENHAVARTTQTERLGRRCRAEQSPAQVGLICHTESLAGEQEHLRCALA